MLEKLQGVVKKMTAAAKMWTPAGLMETLLEMAAEMDRLRAEIEVLKGKK